MGRTSTEKILAALSGRKDVEPGDIVMADLDLVVDWKQGSVRNLASGSELAGRPLPDQLLDIAERGGFIPILQSEGLLEAIE